MRIVIEVSGEGHEDIDWIEVRAHTAEIRRDRAPVFNPFPGLTHPPPAPDRIVLEANVRTYTIHTKSGEVIEGEVLGDVTYTEPAPKEIEG